MPTEKSEGKTVVAGGVSGFQYLSTVSSYFWILLLTGFPTPTLEI